MIPLWLSISQKIDQLLTDIITGDIHASAELVDRLMELKTHIQEKYNEQISGYWWETPEKKCKSCNKYYADVDKHDKTHVEIGI